MTLKYIIEKTPEAFRLITFESEQFQGQKDFSWSVRDIYEDRNMSRIIRATDMNAVTFTQDIVQEDIPVAFRKWFLLIRRQEKLDQEATFTFEVNGLIYRGLCVRSKPGVNIKGMKAT